MKRVIVIIICFGVLIGSSISVQARSNNDFADDEMVLDQIKFSYILEFYNNFAINDYGKATLTSFVDSRNVDRCRISMYLQRYDNGSWVTVKQYTETDESTYCGVSNKVYVWKGYQYRMKSYTYVYVGDSYVEYDTYVSKVICY